MCDEVAADQPATQTEAAAPEVQAVVPGRLITADLLRYRSACSNQVEEFEAATGGQVVITEQWASDHAKQFDFYWAMDSLLSRPALIAAHKELEGMRYKGHVAERDMAKLFARHWISDPEPVTVPPAVDNTEETNTQPAPAAVGLEG